MDQPTVVQPKPTPEQLQKTLQLLSNANKNQPALRELELLDHELDRSHLTLRICIEHRSSLTHDWHKIVDGLQNTLSERVISYREKNEVTTDKPSLR